MDNNTAQSPDVYTSTAVDRKLIIDFSFIVLLLCATCIVAPANANFPMIDDWLYGRILEQFLLTADYRPMYAANPTFITNALWGALFCLPTGFSYAALHVSTLVASTLALTGTYILIRDLQQPRWLAILGALLLGFNPVYFLLSHTFETDVLFIALSIWAAIFLARSFVSNSDSQLIVGTILAIAATLSRQLAFFVPVSFAFTSLLSSKIPPRKAILPLIVCAGSFIAFKGWLVASGRLPKFSDVMTIQIAQTLTNPRQLLILLLGNVFSFLSYLGLFLLPVLIITINKLLQSRRFQANVLPVIGLVSASVLAMIIGAEARLHYGEEFRVYVGETSVWIMPITGWYFVKTGLGMLTIEGYSQMLHLPHSFWLVVTVISFFGALLAAILLSIYALDIKSKVLQRKNNNSYESTVIFLLLCGIIYLLPFFLVGVSDDRYLLPSIPFLAAGIAGIGGRLASRSIHISRTIRLAMFTIIFAFGSYAIIGTRDYLTWNRLRWQALEYLTRDNRIKPEDIDGGYEFIGLHFFKEDPLHLVPDPWSRVHSRSPTYVIAFGALPGYTTIKEYTYQHWLPPHEQKVVILRKD